MQFEERRKFCLKSDFSKVFSYFHLLVEVNQKKTFISVKKNFSKIAQITYFYAFILILRQYIFFL